MPVPAGRGLGSTGNVGCVNSGPPHHRTRRNSTRQVAADEQSDCKDKDDGGSGAVAASEPSHHRAQVKATSQPRAQRASTFAEKKLQRKSKRRLLGNRAGEAGVRARRHNATFLRCPYNKLPRQESQSQEQRPTRHSRSHGVRG